MLNATNKRDCKIKLATMIHRAGQEMHQLYAGSNFPTSALFSADERVNRLLTCPNLSTVKTVCRRLTLTTLTTLTTLMTLTTLGTLMTLTTR